MKKIIMIIILLLCGCNVSSSNITNSSVLATSSTQSSVNNSSVKQVKLTFIQLAYDFNQDKMFFFGVYSASILYFDYEYNLQENELNDLKDIDKTRLDWCGIPGGFTNLQITDFYLFPDADKDSNYILKPGIITENSVYYYAIWGTLPPY